MKTYDASLIEVLQETEHYAKIFHPAMKGMTVDKSIFFLEWLWTVGYRYIFGDDWGAKFIVCEKITSPR